MLFHRMCVVVFWRKLWGKWSLNYLLNSTVHLQLYCSYCYMVGITQWPRWTTSRASETTTEWCSCNLTGSLERGNCQKAPAPFKTRPVAQGLRQRLHFLAMSKKQYLQSFRASQKVADCNILEEMVTVRPSGHLTNDTQNYLYLQYPYLGVKPCFPG